MISEKIKTFIENESAKISKTNQFLMNAHRGTTSREDISNYLFNLSLIFSKATTDLAEAAKKSQEMGIPVLQEFMSNKISEETGHDEWAKSDLKNYSEFDPSKGDFSVEAYKLSSFITGLAKNDPRLYLAYMSFVEYFTVLVGPELLTSLELHCNIQRSTLSAISNHQEADKDHYKEDLEIFNQINIDTNLENQIFETFSETIHLIHEFLNSCISNQ